MGSLDASDRGVAKMPQRLVLGCGQYFTPEPGTLYVDVRPFPNVTHVMDLNQVPWGFADSQFIHVSAIHLVEHLDSLVDFMSECHRVLAPGGSLYLETPLAGGDVDLEWADPTHKRCYRIHTFVNYFSPEGVERWGYTDRAWNIFHLKVVDNCIILHAYPIKA